MTRKLTPSPNKKMSNVYAKADRLRVAFPCSGLGIEAIILKIDRWCNIKQFFISEPYEWNRVFSIPSEQLP